MANPFNINSTRCKVSRYNVLKIKLLDLIHDTLTLTWWNTSMNFGNLKTI